MVRESESMKEITNDAKKIEELIEISKVIKDLRKFGDSSEIKVIIEQSIKEKIESVITR